MTKEAIPLVVVGPGHFMLFQFFDLGTLQKIVSLSVMGDSSSLVAIFIRRW